VKVCVSPEPRLRVPPDPLMVNPPPFTLPIKVTVPAVFNIDTVLVVVNPAMLNVVLTAPLSVTVLPPKLRVPPLVLARFPCIIKFPEGVAVVPVPLNVRL